MPRDMWLYAAYAQRRHNSAAMRALLDFLETHGKMQEPPEPVPPPSSTAVKPVRPVKQAKPAAAARRARQPVAAA
jgi:hypothetical protein